MAEQQTAVYNRVRITEITEWFFDQTVTLRGVVIKFLSLEKVKILLFSMMISVFPRNEQVTWRFFHEMAHCSFELIVHTYTLS
jgi:hypothetical protein